MRRLRVGVVTGRERQGEGGDEATEQEGSGSHGAGKKVRHGSSGAKPFGGKRHSERLRNDNARQWVVLHTDGVITRASRRSGGVYGLLIGDALGVPYEFHRAADVPARGAIEMDPPAGFPRAHRGVPPGTWSDDGAQALALLASLLDRDGLDPTDLGARFVAWYDDGAYAVDGLVFDVGIQTANAIRALKSGVSALDAGGTDERSNGNGSLMRVLPLALFHRGSDEALAEEAMRQSRVTHRHPRSQLCCALYVLWARGFLREARDPWADAVRVTRGVIAVMDAAAERDFAEALEVHVRPDEAPEGHGSGYVVDTLRSARQIVETGVGYEDAVRAAIALGDDTDTTACVTGGIVGVRDGVDAIPLRWREALRGRELVDPLVERLLARAAG